MRLLRRPLRAASGAALVEILISAIILGIIIVPIFDTLVSGRMLTARRGEKRMAHHLVERKIEQLLNAGYGSADAASDVTSRDLSYGSHPTNPGIVVNTRGDTSALNDVVGSMTWNVQRLAWPSAGDTVHAKQVEVKLVWPAQTPRDSVWITTIIGA
jgi:Tfp pilus assembly protein PilX